MMLVKKKVSLNACQDMYVQLCLSIAAYETRLPSGGRPNVCMELD